jgi:hypothetical protein
VLAAVGNGGGRGRGESVSVVQWQMQEQKPCAHAQGTSRVVKRAYVTHLQSAVRLAALPARLPSAQDRFGGQPVVLYECKQAGREGCVGEHADGRLV